MSNFLVRAYPAHGLARLVTRISTNGVRLSLVFFFISASHDVCVMVDAYYTFYKIPEQLCANSFKVVFVRFIRAVDSFILHWYILVLIW